MALLCNRHPDCHFVFYVLSQGPWESDKAPMSWESSPSSDARLLEAWVILYA